MGARKAFSLLIFYRLPFCLCADVSGCNLKEVDSVLVLTYYQDPSRGNGDVCDGESSFSIGNQRLQNDW
mgnify:CR=1 FL=1